MKKEYPKVSKGGMSVEYPEAKKGDKRPLDACVMQGITLTETEFLKEHPSLKGKEQDFMRIYRGVNPSDEEHRYLESDIHETQIDKQKVMDEFMVLKFELQGNPEQERINVQIERSLRELGLSK